MSSLLLAVSILVSMILVLPAAANKGYNARLEEYKYPFEVRYRSFRAQRHQLEMAYMDVRPKSGADPEETVLLLHGKNFSGAYWERTIRNLVKDGYRVIVPDQIGFGKSSKPVNFQYSFHALANHTADLLDQLYINSVTVVGHSMGGMLATRFALMAPERTNRLVLVNPIGLEDWKRTVPYRTIDEWYRRELGKTPAGVKEYMRESYFDGEWSQAYDPLLDIQAGWIRGPDYERIARVSARTYDMIFTQPVLYEFDDLTMPTLLIIGQRDRTALGTGMVSDTVARTLGRYDKLDEKTARAIPNSTLVELPGIGHVPHYEAFDQFYGALKPYLEQQ
jgi:pimeloyl-ACP methyl ester carboxylesterase